LTPACGAASLEFNLSRQKISGQAGSILQKGKLKKSSARGDKSFSQTAEKVKATGSDK
jgi:hypothetical protein